MATTYGASPSPAAEDADPTFVAFQNAQNHAQDALARTRDLAQSRLGADVQTGTNKLAIDQQNQVQDNLNQYRSQGFGQSGIEAQGEDRIRTAIAQQIQALLTNYQRGTQDVSNTYTNTMDQNAVDLDAQRSAALQRMVQDQATAGVGL